MNGLDFPDDMVVREGISPTEQMFSEGVRVFGLSEERQKNISICRKVYNDTNKFLTFIFPPIVGTFFDKIDDFFKHKETKFPRIDEGVNLLKEFLIRTPGNNLTNDFAITMAMASEQELEKFRHILFLIHFWKEAPECIGTIPSEDEFTITKKPEGSTHITSKSNASAHYMRLANHYFHTLVGDNKRTYTLFIRMKGSDDVINYNMNGNSASGNTQMLPAGIAEDASLETIENYIIIGGHILTQGIADIVPIYRLIDKHWGSIDAVIDFLRLKRCSFFDTPNARKYIKNKREEANAEVSTGIGKTQHRTRKVQGQKTVPVPVRSTGVIHRRKEVPNFENFVYPVPEITGSFSSDLSRGKSWNGMRNKLCTNIPHSKETILWVFEPNEDGSNSWKPYSDAEVVKFSYIQDFTYRFCLISNTEKAVEPPEDSEKNPISEVTINRKEQIKADGLAKVQRSVHALTGNNTLTDTDNPPSNDNTIATVSQNPIELYAEDILSAIIDATPTVEGSALANNIRITISLSSGEKRVIHIGRDNKNPDTNMVVISGGDESMNREVEEMLREELWQFYRTHGDAIWQAEISRIGSKMQITSGNINTVMYDLGLSREATDYKSEIYSYRWNDIFAGRAIMQDWARDVREVFMARCQSEGIHPYFEVVEETLPKRTPKKQLKISCSLKGESGISGSITSSDADPYYKIEVPEHMPVELKQALAGVLQELLSFTGVIGKWYFEPKSLPGTSKRNTNTAPSKEEVNDLISLISGTRKKHIRPFAILEPEERNVIEERLKQFQNRRGKVLLSEGFDYQTDIYTCVIQSRKGFDFLEANPSCKIVLKDEVVSALKGQKYVGDIIIKNDRLKKYLANRIIATLRKGVYKGVSPLSNGMKEVFDKFWDKISDEKQELFIHSMESNAGNALNVYIDGETPLIDALVYEWGYANIDLRYSRPQVISAAEFMFYKTELGM